MNEFHNSNDDYQDESHEQQRSEKMYQKKAPIRSKYKKKRKPIRRGIKQRRVRRPEW